MPPEEGVESCSATLLGTKDEERGEARTVLVTGPYIKMTFVVTWGLGEGVGGVGGGEKWSRGGGGTKWGKEKNEVEAEEKDMCRLSY